MADAAWALRIWNQCRAAAEALIEAWADGVALEDTFVKAREASEVAKKEFGAHTEIDKALLTKETGTLALMMKHRQIQLEAALTICKKRPPGDSQTKHSKVDWALKLIDNRSATDFEKLAEPKVIVDLILAGPDQVPRNITSVLERIFQHHNQTYPQDCQWPEKWIQFLCKRLRATEEACEQASVKALDANKEARSSEAEMEAKLAASSAASNAWTAGSMGLSTSLEVLNTISKQQNVPPDDPARRMRELVRDLVAFACAMPLVGPNPSMSSSPKHLALHEQHEAKGQALLARGASASAADAGAWLRECDRIFRTEQELQFAPADLYLRAMAAQVAIRHPCDAHAALDKQIESFYVRRLVTCFKGTVHKLAQDSLVFLWYGERLNAFLRACGAKTALYKEPLNAWLHHSMSSAVVDGSSPLTRSMLINTMMRNADAPNLERHLRNQVRECADVMSACERCQCRVCRAALKVDAKGKAKSKGQRRAEKKTDGLQERDANSIEQTMCQRARTADPLRPPLLQVSASEQLHGA